MMSLIKWLEKLSIGDWAIIAAIAILIGKLLGWITW